MQMATFNPMWITSDKLDVRALYRRPAMDARGQRRLDDAGRPAWDITSGLPVRRHNDWTAKGFEFLALATWADVLACRSSLEAAGTDVAALVDSYESVGEPNRRGFRVSAYLAGIAHDATLAYGRLAELVREHGSDAVRDTMRASNPRYELPEALQGFPAPGAGATEDDSPEAAPKRRGWPKGKPRAKTVPVGAGAGEGT